MTDFIKYPKIFAFGHEESQQLLEEPDHDIVIQEKMDGANFRFFFKDGAIVFGSRSQQLTSSTGEEVNVGKNFRRCLEYVKKTIPEDMIKKYERHIFFGECMVKHSMNYDWEEMPPYLGFDIWDMNTEQMLDFEKVQSIFVDLGLPIVPFIKTIKAREITDVNEEMIPLSAYPPKANPKQQAEGIVFKNYQNGVMAKVVTANFKELNAETFGGTPKHEETDTGKISARYCSNARIEKIIFKLMDEDVKLEMSMMDKLPKRVFEDIWEEHMKEILHKYSEIKPREMKKIVAKRCVAVLNQVMINNSLN